MTEGYSMLKNLSGTTYIVLVPELGSTNPSIDYIQRIDTDPFTTFEPLDVGQNSYVIAFAEPTPGTVFVAAGESNMIIFDYTNIATSALLRTVSLPQAMRSYNGMPTQTYYLTARTDLFKFSWSTDAQLGSISLGGTNAKYTITEVSGTTLVLVGDEDATPCYAVHHNTLILEQTVVKSRDARDILQIPSTLKFIGNGRGLGNVFELF